jgi:proline iminopeptidase
MIEIPENATIQSGNAVLAAKLYTKIGAETIILLHGGPGVPDEMTEVREFLAEHMQVITFDQRGTGSDNHKKCTYSIPDYISDVTNIAAYFNLEKFHLFGHSWGGLYAQIYAQELPGNILSLFLCSPASGTGKVIWRMTENEVLKYNRNRSTNREWLTMGLNSLFGLLGSSKAYRRLFRQVIINYHKGYGVAPPEPEKLAKINARSMNKTRRNIKQYPPLKIFGKTNIPVIITYGQYDTYGQSKEYVFERFPHARYETIPNCGHTPWKHNKPAFEKILLEFYTVIPRTE